MTTPKPAIGQRWKYTSNQGFFIVELNKINSYEGFVTVSKGIHYKGMKTSWALYDSIHWRYLPGQDKISL